MNSIFQIKNKIKEYCIWFFIEIFVNYKRLKSFILAVLFGNNYNIFTAIKVKFNKEFIKEFLWLCKTEILNNSKLKIYGKRMDEKYDFTLFKNVSEIDYSWHPSFMGYRKKRYIYTRETNDENVFFYIIKEFKANYRKQAFPLPLSFYLSNTKSKKNLGIYEQSYSYLKWRKPINYVWNVFKYSYLNIGYTIKYQWLNLTGRFSFSNPDFKLKEEEPIKPYKSFWRVPLRWYRGKLMDYSLDELYVAVREADKETFDREDFDDYLLWRLRVVCRHFVLTRSRILLRMHMHKLDEEEAFRQYRSKKKISYNFRDVNAHIVDIIMNIIKLRKTKQENKTKESELKSVSDFSNRHSFSSSHIHSNNSKYNYPYDYREKKISDDMVAFIDRIRRKLEVGEEEEQEEEQEEAVNKNENKENKSWWWFKFYHSPSSWLPFKDYEGFPFWDYGLDYFYNHWSRRVYETQPLKGNDKILKVTFYKIYQILKNFYVKNDFIYENIIDKNTYKFKYKSDLLILNPFDFYILLVNKNQIKDYYWNFESNLFSFILKHLDFFYFLIIYIYIVLFFYCLFRLLLFVFLYFSNKEKQNRPFVVNEYFSEPKYSFYEYFGQYFYNKKSTNQHDLLKDFIRKLMKDNKLNLDKWKVYEKYNKYFNIKENSMQNSNFYKQKNKFELIKQINFNHNLLDRESLWLNLFYRDNTELKYIMEQHTKIKMPSLLNYFNYILYLTSKENKHLNYNLLDGIFFNYYNRYIFDDLFFKIVLKEASFNTILKKRSSNIYSNIINAELYGKALDLKISKRDWIFKYDINTDIIPQSKKFANVNIYSKDWFRIRTNFFDLPTTKSRFSKLESDNKLILYFFKLFKFNLDFWLLFFFAIITYWFVFYQNFFIIIIIFFIICYFYVKNRISLNIYIQDSNWVLKFRNIFMIKYFYSKEYKNILSFYIIIIFAFYVSYYYIFDFLFVFYYILRDFYLIDLNFEFIKDFFEMVNVNLTNSKFINDYLDYVKLYISLTLNFHNIIIKKMQNYKWYKPYSLKELYREFVHMNFKDWNRFSLFNLIFPSSSFKLFENWKMEPYRPLYFLFWHWDANNKRRHEEKRPKAFWYYHFFYNIRKLDIENALFHQNFFGEYFLKSIDYFWKDKLYYSKFWFYRFYVQYHASRLNTYMYPWDHFNLKWIFIIIKIHFKQHKYFILFLLFISFVIVSIFFSIIRKQYRYNRDRLNSLISKYFKK